MTLQPCVLGVAEHAGWAHVVCVAARDHVPVVIDRRRVTLIDPGLPTQPYHHEARAMKEDDADALIARVRGSVTARTADALQHVLDDLAPTHMVVALAIRRPPFADLPPTVAQVLESYPLMCAADGMMYQLALCHAARELELDVQQCRRGDEAARAADQLGVTPQEIEAFIERSRPSGPPWTQEHRRAYAAGIAVLAAHSPGRLRIQTHGP